jgi:di/tricarboxylate transporter
MHEELQSAGFEGFNFFSLTPVGLAVLAVAVGYMLLVGRSLLPASTDNGAALARRSVFDIWEDFSLDRRQESLGIGADSPLVGLTIAEAELESRYRSRIMGIERSRQGGERRISAPSSEVELRAGDTLVVIGRAVDRERLTQEQSLTSYPASERRRQRWLWEMGGVAVLIHPDSPLIGQSLRSAEFRTRYELQVLGLRRGREPVDEFEDLKLEAGDSLFLAGPWRRIKNLQSLHHDFVVLETPAEQAEVVPAYRRMPVGLAILAGMVLLTLFDVVPLVAAVLIAVLAAGATRCLTTQDAYRSIHWSSLVLIAGMLPLADALQQTGGTDLVVGALMSVFGDASPMIMLTVIFFLTAGLGLVLSNTASAVLVAPIAVYAAEALNVSPYPFALAVVIAASAAFSTPVSTPVVTLVVEPGRYGFMDFVKIGVPLLLLTYAATALVAPLVFPFAG